VLTNIMQSATALSISTVSFALLDKKDCIHTIEAHTPERVIKSIERLKKYTE